jgi:glycosyltransferase involved in cell wall biosynthesis
MRVLWLAHRDVEHPLAGGAEVTISEVGKRLVNVGIEMHVVTGGWPGAPRFEEIDGVRYHRFGRAIVPHLLSPAAVLGISPDVVVDDLAHAMPWGSERLGIGAGTAFFHHRHLRTLPGQTSRFMAFLLTRLESNYRTFYPTWPFVTESKSAYQDLLELGIEPSRIRLIPPGVDFDHFRPGCRSPLPSVLYFAGLRPYKRPELAVQAFRHVLSTFPECRLIVVGGGPSASGLRQLARELGIESSCEFTGRVPRTELPRILSAAWVNLHTSIAEGWGFSIMEAAAAGVPTVAFRVPGVCDSIVEERTGLLVSEPSSLALASAVERVLGDPAAMADHCREWAEAHSWDTTAACWVDHLSSLAEVG